MKLYVDVIIAQSSLMLAIPRLIQWSWSDIEIALGCIAAVYQNEHWLEFRQLLDSLEKVRKSDRRLKERMKDRKNGRKVQYLTMLYEHAECMLWSQVTQGETSARPVRRNEKQKKNEADRLIPQTSYFQDNLSCQSPAPSRAIQFISDNFNVPIVTQTLSNSRDPTTIYKSPI